MAARIAWIFRDLTTDPVEEYLWEVNPKEFDVGYKKTLQYQAASAPDGRVLAFEGRDEVKKIAFTGTILSEQQYDKMIYWFNKRHQLQLTDDLGRVFSIYVTSFQPKRERAASHPWKHSYSCEAIILDWS